MNQTLNLSCALATFEDNLVDIRKACVNNIVAITASHKPYKELAINTRWTTEDITQHIRYILVTEKTKPMLVTIKRIDSRRRYFGTKGITDDDILRAKEVPLTELYENSLKGGKTKHGICPFHQEKTPSFAIFPDNRFKCFGCNVHGTPIDYIMLRDGIDFIKAVKALI